MPRHTTYPMTLKDWRDERGLSVREAAKMLGISYTTVNRVERGLRALRGQEAKRISVLTGVSIAALVGAE